MVARTGGQFLTVVGVAHLVFIGYVEACLWRFQWKLGLSPWRSFSFSVWWFHNLRLNSCNIKWQKTRLFNMWFLLKWPKTPILRLHGEMGNTCGIRMLFDSKSSLAYTFICKLRVSLSSQNWIVILILLPYRWWFQFLAGCCCAKTNVIVKGSTPN